MSSIHFTTGSMSDHDKATYIRDLVQVLGNDEVIKRLSGRRQEAGEIHTLGHINFPELSDELIAMWRDLFRQKNEGDLTGDSLDQEESALYRALTQKISTHLSIIIVVSGESDPQPP